LFGDPVGLPQLLRLVERDIVVGLVGASIRPDQHTCLAAIAERTGLPLLIQPRAKDAGYPDFVRQLRALAPDLMVVNSYAMILHPDVLATPRFGAINVHGALLPAYRGANPTEWALINGERETGVTIHAIDAGIDTGPIIAQRRVPIYFADTWRDVRRRVTAATEALLAETLPAILAGTAALHPQDESIARHWPRRSAEDGRFEWSRPAIDIYNLVRALVHPHPGATVAGETIHTWRPLDELVWRKYRAGAGQWTEGRWRLVPQRPTRRASRQTAGSLRFDLKPRAGRPVGWCAITGIEASKGPVRAGLDVMPRARLAGSERRILRALVRRFAELELRRDVEFC
jgi:methionyl-tRNA formyltransferase